MPEIGMEPEASETRQRQQAATASSAENKESTTTTVKQKKKTLTKPAHATKAKTESALRQQARRNVREQVGALLTPVYDDDDCSVSLSISVSN